MAPRMALEWVGIGLSLCLAVNLAAQAPSNDAFAAADVLAGTKMSVKGSNQGATAESGEPLLLNQAAASSVWFRWTAPGSGLVTVSTRGSTFDTMLGAYAGTAFGALQPMDVSDDTRSGLEAETRFHAVAGEIYHFQVTGFAGASGEIALKLDFREALGTLYATSFDSPVFANGGLVGMDGWAGGNGGFDVVRAGTLERVPGRAAYFGFNPPLDLTSPTILWRRIGAQPLADGRPIVHIDMDLYLREPSFGSRGAFYLGLHNQQGEWLGGILFSENSNEIWVHTGGSWQPITGAAFVNSEYRHLSLTIDFQSNVWSINYAAQQLVSGIAFAPGGLVRDLGTLAFHWVIADTIDPGDDYIVFDGLSVISRAKNGEHPGGLEAPGGLRREQFRMFTGHQVRTMLEDFSFPDEPRAITHMASFEAPVDVEEFGGQRVYGWLAPPLTGDYTFFLSGDDEAELYLSTDSTPAARRLIAREPTWTGSRDWTGTARRVNRENISAPIHLTAGQKYYVEALCKEKQGGDHLSVAWQLPGEPAPQNGDPPIPSEYLIAPARPVDSSGAPRIFSTTPSRAVHIGDTIKLYVYAGGERSLSYQWWFNGSPVTGGTSRVLTLTDFGALNAGTYEVEVSNAFGSVRSIPFVLRPEPVFGIGQPVQNPANGHYYVLLESSSWLAAKAAGDLAGGWLVSLGDSLEQQWVQQTFENFDGVGRHFWIGLFDPDPFQNDPDPFLRKDEFQWVSGEPMTFENWSPGEPNFYLQTDEFYVNTWHGSGSWNDNSNENPWNGILELPQLSYPLPGITVEPADQLAPVGGPVSLSVATVGSPYRTFQWYRGDTALPLATNSVLAIPAAAFIDQSTNYTVLVKDILGSARSNPARITLGAASNDEFANAPLITDRNAAVTGSNVGATPDPGDVGGRSIWWRWTPPTDGVAIIHTAGSSIDTILSVFEGVIASGAALRGADDDGGPNGSSRIQLSVAGGTPYLIGVDGRGAPGEIRLTVGVNQPPVIGFSNPPNGTMMDQPGFLDIGGGGLDPDGVIQQVVLYNHGDPIASYNGDSFFETLFLNSGHYEFEMAAIDNEGLSATSAKVQVTVAESVGLLVPPLNDGFDGSEVLSGAAPHSSGWTFHATAELGEPAHAGGGGGRSVWWSWTAPTSGRVIINTTGSEIDTVLAVYTGSSVNNLVLVAADDDSGPGLTSEARFLATQGQQYRVAVDGYAGAQGNVKLRVSLNQQPQVELTQPANGSILTAPANLVLAANAIDPDHGIERVEFELNGSVIHSAGAPPFEFSLSGLVAGTYRFSARAVDLLGESMRSPEVAVEVQGAALPPSISGLQGSSQVLLGQQTEIRVNASGSSPLSYQWRRDGVEIPGATSDVFRVNSATALDSGTYSVVVSNSVGVLSSAGFNLTVPVPPRFLAQPTSRSAPRGAEMILAVAVTGTQPLVFQWFHEDQVLAGATGPSLELSPFQDIHAGRYHLEVSNAAGFLRSQEALVTIEEAPADNLPAARARADFWIPNGRVHAVLATNGLVYLGGEFDYVGPNLGSGAVIEPLSGVVDTAFPHVNGEIHAVVSDHQGGWFIGGDFTLVGGHSRSNLAHIRADRTLDLVWTPNSDGEVQALAVFGNSLFVGGLFQSIGGLPRSNLARVDILTGRVEAWSPALDGAVQAIEVAGDRVFIAGSFEHAGGENRKRFAAVSLDTDAILPWQCNANAAVIALAASGGVLFAGGDFTQLGGVARSYLAAISIQNGAVIPWPASVDGAVHSLAVNDGTLFAGGSFTSAGATGRNGAAAFDAGTGQLLPFNPAVNGTVWNLWADGSQVYLGGEFSSLGIVQRLNLARVDQATGEPDSWNPSASDRVRAIARSGGLLYVGGRFVSAGGVRRSKLAALDAATGKPIDWNPGADGTVFALAIRAGVVIAGGNFSIVGGRSSSSLAALDSGNAQALELGVRVSGTVRALLVRNDTLYLGGSVSSVNGLPRSGVAAIDLTAKSPLPWSPAVLGAVGAVGEVYALAATDNTIYLGGAFDSVDGVPRANLAAVSAELGSLRSWAPAADDRVLVLLAIGETVYAGGLFGKINGVHKNSLAALDRANGGSVQAWHPILPPPISVQRQVRALAIRDNDLYFAGAFNGINAELRRNAGAVDLVTGGAMDWNPNADNVIRALSVFAGRFYAGGDFTRVGGVPRPFLAAFATEGEPVFLRQPSSLTVGPGSTVALSAAISGRAPLIYQWSFNGSPLEGQNGSVLVLPNVQALQAGHYAVRVSNEAGTVASTPAVLRVLAPPVITSQPSPSTVTSGSSAVLSVQATGAAPVLYQWFKNGVLLAGQTKPSLRITVINATHAGSYHVEASNDAGRAISTAASLAVSGGETVLADAFLGSGLLAPSGDNVVFTGRVQGSNAAATREEGEPFHAGKTGGKSVWISWKAPATGVLRVNTSGSGFDTLLGLYTGAILNRLQVLAASEDGANYFASEVLAAVSENTIYHIAVDGLAGASGAVVINWIFERSSEDVPRITQQPKSLAVAPGGKAIFAVIAESVRPLSYRWFRHGHSIQSTDAPTLVIESVRVEDVGMYTVEISNGPRTVRSTSAMLEMGSSPNLLSQDKFHDLVAELFPGAPGPASDGRRQSYASVAAGVPGFHITDNFGSTSELSEPEYCGLRGGASRWFWIDVTAPGTLVVDTQGSSFDTILAIFTGSSLAALNPAGCDDNGAPDGIRSLLRLAVIPQRYIVAVDGVHGATGIIKLNWRLGEPPSVSSPPTSATVSPGQPVVFGINSQGFPPPSIQWQFNGANLQGETNATLRVGSVQMLHHGRYRVVLTNLVGVATSPEAMLQVLNPFDAARRLRIGLAEGLPGNLVRVPVLLEAQGNEAGASFSVNFNPAVLAFQSTELGEGAPTAALNSNVTLAGSGRVGISMALPPGDIVVTGVRVIIVLRFTIPAGVPFSFAAVSIGDVPLSREIVDTAANPLGGTFENGGVNVGGAYEADLMPRPNGDSSITVADWVMIGRLAAGLEPAQSPGEFQKADCAPRNGLGDGQLAVNDWVQAGRYAAGLDTWVAVGGATAPRAPVQTTSLIVKDLPNPALLGSAGSAFVWVGSFIPRTPGLGAPVWIHATGRENAIGFSIARNRAGAANNSPFKFEPSPIWESSQLGSDPRTGVWGVLLALPPGSTLEPGCHLAGWIELDHPPLPEPGLTFQFRDTPVLCLASDARANQCATLFLDAPQALTVVPMTRPAVRIQRTSTVLPNYAIALAQPSAWEWVLEFSVDLEDWREFGRMQPGMAEAIGIPSDISQGYFRLRQAAGEVAR